MLGKEDGIQLGILNINPDGRMPEEKVRCITPEILQDTIKDGIVSDGQTQAQIDASMAQITDDYKEVFIGMGRAKVPPIHIEMKEDARPITQPKRPIPIQLREATIKKLKELKDNDLIEGPLPPRECKGWLTNMVVTKKKWASDEVRINIDTKRMNDQLITTKIPIPTPEELRHSFNELQSTHSYSLLNTS